MRKSNKQTNTVKNLYDEDTLPEMKNMDDILEKEAINLGEINMMPVSKVNSCDALKEPTTSKTVPVGVYKTSPEVKTPEYMTEQSACFDLFVHLGNELEYVTGVNRLLMATKKHISSIRERDNKRGFYIDPGETVMVPTGLIFDIPEGYQIQIFPRSGSSSKKHLKASNCVGIVDSDYVKETNLLIHNDSEIRQSIVVGDRIFQAQIVPVYQAQFTVLDSPPAQKTSRVDGMGHTGE